MGGKILLAEVDSQRPVSVCLDWEGGCCPNSSTASVDISRLVHPRLVFFPVLAQEGRFC